MLVFGKTGTKVIFFPTRSGRFFDYENWQLIDGIKEHFESGAYQFFCVDSIDAESFYSTSIGGHLKLERHRSYENYIINEVIPFANSLNPSGNTITIGCSMGAFHAISMAFRHPNLFSKTIGMSGRYDLTMPMGVFRNLLDDYYDLNVYFFMPSHFIPNIKNGPLLERIKKIDTTITIGVEDAFYHHNLQFHDLLSKKGIKNKIVILEGESHNFKFWKETLKTLL